MSGHRAPADYDERLVAYITKRVRENKVPPTIDEIIRNVEGISSKSTVFVHCKKLVDEGYLTQKNEKGYYYPVSLDTEEVLVPTHLLHQIEKILMEDPKNVMITKKLQDIIKEK